VTDREQWRSHHQLIHSRRTIVSGSPEGNELRQWANAQEALAADVAALARRFGALGPDCGSATSGFPFAGPFEVEVRARIGQATKLLDLADGQLGQAASRIRKKATDYRGRAVAADIAYMAAQALEDLTDGDL